MTSIDVRATFKEKLDVDFDKYIILGACNPALAHEALLAEEEVGLLLPCNLIVYEKEGKTPVGKFDPMTITRLSQTERLHSIATEVTKRLEKVLRRLEK